jgi:Mrp family chromosome partitioning ATPase
LILTSAGRASPLCWAWVPGRSTMARWGACPCGCGAGLRARIVPHAARIIMPPLLKPFAFGGSRWAPVYAGEGQTLAVMSIGFLLQNREDAVVWRGPRKTAMVQQFLHEVCWGDLDYLVVDTPPGTSDEHLALAEALVGATRDVPVSAILVTTPQNVALADVAREISFCVQAHIPILGLVENMSGFVCPHCTVRYSRIARDDSSVC